MTPDQTPTYTRIRRCVSPGCGVVHPTICPVPHCRGALLHSWDEAHRCLLAGHEWGAKPSELPWISPRKLAYYPSQRPSRAKYTA